MKKFVKLISSQVDGVHYDQQSKELWVKFSSRTEQLKSCTLYRYADVPSDKALDLIFAESPGSYLNTHIKSVHPFEKLEGQEVTF